MMSEKVMCHKCHIIHITFKSVKKHSQIRPIFTFKFSIFVFFQKLKEDLLNDLVLCFNNFSKEIKAQKIEIIMFSYHKNVHFA